MAELPESKVCPVCDAAFTRDTGQSWRHWEARVYCSQACCRAVTMAGRPREANPNWKGAAADPQRGRARAKRWYPDASPCERCGAEKAERHHRDANPLNNEPGNIAWLCRKCHVAVDGRAARFAATRCPGESHGMAKLTDAIVRQARARFALGESAAAIAREHGVDRHTMSRAIRGITWSHIQGSV